MSILAAVGIRDMPGPHFLAFYAAVILGTLIVVRGIRRLSDRSLDSGPCVLPPKPDPLELAYLRGGDNEATRFVIFDLLSRGYLQFAKDDKLEQASRPPPLQHLSTLDAAVFKWFDEPRSATDVFATSNIPSYVRKLGEKYEQRLSAQQLLTARMTKLAALCAWLSGTALVAGLGGYKLLVALGKGRHNVAFLVLLGVAGLILLVALSIPPRLSRRGKAYLRELERAFEGLKERAAKTILAANDPTWPLLVGVFGISALVGTVYAPVTEVFRKAQQAESSWGGCGGAGGCGGGCGGGGCGGGGCGGGGCGGCGS